MKIAITGDTEVESKTLIEEVLKSRGHTVVYFTHMYLNLGNMDELLFGDIDLVYYWGGVGPIGRVCFSDYIDHHKNIPFINRSILEDPLLESKIYQAYKIFDHGLPHPKTIVQSYAQHKMLSEVLSLPYVAKVTQWSSGGRDVALIHSEKDLDCFKEENTGKELLYQEYIDYDADYRVHVIGGKAVCAYERVPPEDDFRANISLGGSLVRIEDQKILSELFDLAEKTSACFKGLDISGVDIIRDRRSGELYSIEVNKTPGIKQVKEITGVDVAEKIADYIESQVKKV